MLNVIESLCVNLVTDIFANVLLVNNKGTTNKEPALGAVYKVKKKKKKKERKKKTSRDLYHCSCYPNRIQRLYKNVQKQ